MQYKMAAVISEDKLANLGLQWDLNLWPLALHKYWFLLGSLSMLHKTENWENEALITQWSNLPLKAVLKSDLKHLIPNEWKKSNLGESGRMPPAYMYFCYQCVE